MKIMVTGAGGFIGGHLAKRFHDDGHEVVGVDIKSPEYRNIYDMCSQFRIADLRDPSQAFKVFDYFRPERVYALATDMGGMGFIPNNHGKILSNNLRININTLDAAVKYNVERYFFSSSVCVYPVDRLLSDTGDERLLVEPDAYPAYPMDAYGWEKLLIERMCHHYREDYGLETRVARFMNTYGPYGTWTGGREKAPAAFCRKVAESKLRGDDPIQVDVWGDGKQVRSFTYVDDTVEGIIRLTDSDYHYPVNLGYNDEFVTMDDMVVMAFRAMERLHGNDVLYLPGVSITHVPGNQGARNRRESNELCLQVLGWKAGISIREGIARTYPWIEEQVYNASR